MPAESRRSRGFTLLEMLLALTLMGTLLVALNVFVFSMAEVWGKGRDERLFLQHVRAVTAHVEQTLRAAALGPTGDGLEMKEVEASFGAGAPELSFTLAEGGRLIDGAWPETPLPDVELSFGVDSLQPGLNLRWQSRIETRRADEAPRMTVVSPFVTGLAWDYYDDGFKRWETVEQPKREADGTYPLPQRMRLRFALGAMTAERVVTLPARGEGASNF
jgi:prepilin-type N-terminal cleavage/methylation domain-containing protein